MAAKTTRILVDNKYIDQESGAKHFQNIRSKPHATYALDYHLYWEFGAMLVR
jgi:hypothetical protein